MKDDSRDDEPDGVQSRPRGGGRAGSAWISVALPVATLVGGVLIGIVVAGVGDDSDDGGSRGSSAKAPVVPDLDSVAPESCLEAARTVRVATEAIRGGVDAIRNFDSDPILALLDRLENLDRQAREQAAACIGTDVTDADAPTAPPSSTPTDPAPPPADGQDTQTPDDTPTR